MTTKKKTWSAAAVLTLALGGAFTPLQAQSAVAERPVEIERADVLAEQGRLHANLARDFRQASLLLREAAELRGEGTEAVHELVEAGHFAYYGGLKTVAVYTLQKAGKLALTNGDPAAATEAFLDGAWVAREAGKTQVARELLEEGQRLASSTAVAPADRALLMARGGEPR